MKLFSGSKGKEGKAIENRKTKTKEIGNKEIETKINGIKGTGIDLIRIQRIKRAYLRRPERFLHRIFTENEIEFLNAKKNPFPSMAALFAAKEAVSKALGCGIGQVGWCEIEILANRGEGGRGKPVATLRGAAFARAQKLGIRGVEVSLSHDAPYALAQAIAYGE